MKTFFNFDGPFFAFLEKLSTLIVLNILWLICSLPIVTIGASTTALAYSTLRITNGFDDHVTKNFFKAFKKRFKESTIIWLITLAAGIMLYFDLHYFYNSNIKAMFYLSLPIAFIYLLILLYIFPTQYIYNNSIKNAFRNALFFSIMKLPSSLFMVAGAAITVLISFYSDDFFMKFGILYWIFIGFSVISYICSYFLNNIYKNDFTESEYEEKFI
ncbi:MAG: DUF624 domain-containing protein [Lachnospiraceae bacterium]|nr:DUF624 domain-containing protein [Lachnospiraceae bacterium]